MPSAWNRRQLLQGGATAALAAAAARAEPTPVKLPGEVRVGLIGLDGHIGEALKVARERREVKIVAVEMTTDRERQKTKLSPDLAAAKPYSDYRKMLDSEELDVVMICDQNWRRHETVVECLERKIPTAAEKPIGISQVGIAAVRETLAKTRTPLTMLLPMRFTPHFMGMKQIVESGAIGEAVNLSGQKSYQLGVRPDWMKERETYGGSIPYIMCHTVDLLRFISGRDMVATAAFHANVGFPQTGEMENTAAVSYRLDNGGTADLRLDYLRPLAAGSHGDDRIRVAGTQGIIEYRAGKVTLMTETKPLHEITDLPAARTLFADFLDSVYNGSTPALSVDDIFRVSEIVVRSREAADSERVLQI